MNTPPRNCWHVRAVLMLIGVLVGSIGAPCSFASSKPDLRTELPYGVRKVEVKGQPGLPCRAGDGAYISMEIVNFGDWLKTVNGDEERLLLFLDGEAIPSLHPKFFAPEWPEPGVPDPENGGYKTNKISSYGVRFEQNNENRAIWKKLVRSPGVRFEKPMEISVGFANKPPMNTWVYPDSVIEKSPFFLVILSRRQLYLGVLVIIGALALFAVLARKTDILRDPDLPLRPDRTKPFSLARAQMAFWFFLVMGSFFFLWLVSGDTDTLNSSTIALIGISAGTAVSSAFIDAGKRRNRYENVVANMSGTPGQAVAGLKAELKKVAGDLAQAQAAQMASGLGQGAAVSEEKLAGLQERKQLLERQIDFFGCPRWKTATQDMLSENGVISFHRFQMCVWTLVLGIIFISDVYTKLAMPEFSGTLLGLMGVSAGTFIGFKIPEQAGR